MTLAALPPLPDAFRFVETRCPACRHTDCTCPSVRVEECACGEAVALHRFDAIGYAAHVRGDAHSAWRTRQESWTTQASTLTGDLNGAPYDEVAWTNHRAEAPNMHRTNPVCACGRAR
jgi:hypothetical protein